MIKYLGSKRTLLPAILEAVSRAELLRARACDGPSASARPIRTVLDLFSGTSRVGLALKGTGRRVIASDHNLYAATLARCYIQADSPDLAEPAAQLVAEFNALPGSPGYFTRTFCERSRFFQPKNGERIDAIREAIAEKSLPSELEAVMLVSLMEAADRVDSTTGLQMAYLKEWAPRSFNDLELRLPQLLPCAAHGKGEAHCLDAIDAAARFEADAAYIDPPYNQHSYLGNYHIWESLVRWDKPEVYGVACKRVDVRQRPSLFNSRPRCAAALRAVLGALRTDTIILSFSNEGFIQRDEMESILGSLWDGKVLLEVIEHDFKRYVGAQIGIYNPRGDKVGKVGHLRNTEYLYIAVRAP